jgi:hypothetical protein
MKRLTNYTLVLLAGIVLFSLSNCDDNSNIEAAPLQGMISGEAWSFKYTKAFYNEIDNLYDAELYGSQQTQSDPCSVFISGESHLSMQVPNEVGNFQIPSDIQVIFAQKGQGNDFFRATSGFVEISAASGGQVVGFLQAQYDDNNTVEGAFSFNRCN